MNNSDMAKYLNLLSNEIVSLYNIAKKDSDGLVVHSPMKELLREDAEYVAHMPLCDWAEKVYKSRCAHDDT